MLAYILLILGVLYGKTVARVVGDQCLITQSDAIVPTKFNATTQICCLSGVYDRYQEGLEVDCCGDGIYRLGIDLCCNNRVFMMDIQTKTSDKRGRTDVGGFVQGFQVGQGLRLGGGRGGEATEISQETVLLENRDKRKMDNKSIFNLRSLRRKSKRKRHC